jgi:methyltransferase (TIGR00027 family)
MRGRHTRRDPRPLIDDSWGERLVPETARAQVLERALAEAEAAQLGTGGASPEDVVDDYLRRVPAYSNVVLRSRYTEDALAAAVSSGIRQYVVLGAGFDSFFLRRPAFAQDVEVYEIDHPATQDLKLLRMKACGVASPRATHFIAADLGKEELRSALARSTFRYDVPAFVSWLGVTMYLPREANMATLRAIAHSAAPGSELVFTYVDERVLDGRLRSDAYRKLASTVASLNEPFVSGFDPSSLREELAAIGLELIEDLTGPQLVRRYDGDGANGLRSSGASRIALARVCQNSS